LEKKMLQSEYETTVVLRPDISGDLVEGALDRIRGAIDKMDGTLLKINHWGRKKLAYSIAKHGRGVYVNAHFLGGGGLVAEIERNLRISDAVLRFLTVKISDRITTGDYEVSEYERPEYDANFDEDDDDIVGDGSEERGGYRGRDRDDRHDRNDHNDRNNRPDYDA